MIAYEGAAIMGLAVGWRRTQTGRLTVLLAGVSLGLAACGAPKAKPVAEPPPAVEVVQLGAAAGVDVIHATGALKREREPVLSFRIPGVITRLTVQEGDAVRAGQVIATLDATGVEARRRQAAADLELAHRDLDRFEALAERGFAPRQQLENQRTAVVQAKAALDSASFDSRWATLTAPSAGLVLTRTAQSGEVVGAGQAVVSLADETSPLVLRAPLADRDALRVAVGATASIRLEALPGETLTGRISRIAQRADAQSGVVEVEIALDPRPGLRSGLIASADITPTTRAVSGGLRVPAEALLEANGQTAAVLIYTPADRRVHRRAVRFIGFDGDAAVIEGLAAGAQVVTAGAGYVGDGQTVTVTGGAPAGGGQ